MSETNSEICNIESDCLNSKDDDEIFSPKKSIKNDDDDEIFSPKISKKNYDDDEIFSPKVFNKHFEENEKYSTKLSKNKSDLNEKYSPKVSKKQSDEKDIFSAKVSNKKSAEKELYSTKLSNRKSDEVGIHSQKLSNENTENRYFILNGSENIVYDILLWKNPLNSSAIMISLLTLEISVICFSVISVLAYCGLIVLIAAGGLRVYFKFSGNQDENVLESYLDNTPSDGNDTSNNLTNFIGKFDGIILKLRSLLLVEDYFESLKLAMSLYVMTYIGAKFNFMTLCIIVTLTAFSVPKLYQIFQVQLDNFYLLVFNKVSDLLSRLLQKMRQLPVLQQLLRTTRR